MKAIASLIFAGSVVLLTAPAASADPNCRCRLFGEYYELGTTICIRGNLRRCEMNLNNTSWKQIADFCPQANLTPLQKSDPQTYVVRYSLAPVPDWFMHPE
jgi:hypothetical protein